MIRDTLVQLSHIERIRPDEVLLINTIPLSVKRFKRSQSWLGRKVDFIGSQYPKDISWNLYQKVLVEPVLAELAEIVSSGAGIIDYDVSWPEFQRALVDPQFKVYFLLAHHVEKGDAIEFADCAVAFENMFSYLKNNNTAVRKSIHFFICTAGEFLALKQENPSLVNSISVAFWRIPVRASYRFVRYWTMNLQENGDLAFAYTQAIKQFNDDIFSA